MFATLYAYMGKWSKGFTLVELVIVIATIAVLSTIVTIGLTRYQGDVRDARRVSSVTAISEALEKYYDANGEYPSCTAITADSSTVTSSTLVGLEKTTLLSPQPSSGDTNSIECGATSTLTINGTDFYQYDGDGSAACNGSASCLGYTIKYRDESTGEIKTITSRRNTSIATSGAATLTAGAVNLTSVNFTWTTIPNATGYILQSCTVASCASGTTNYTINGGPVTGNATGLTTGTTYWFRVKANDANGIWSNTVSATTATLSTPTPTITFNSPTQLTVSWTPVTYAVDYTLDYSTSSTFSSGVMSVPNITALSQAVTSLIPNTTYYFRLAAINGANSSAYGNGNLATTVPQPTANPTITASLVSGQPTGTVGSVTCTFGSPQYRQQYRATATATNGAWQAWTAFGSTQTYTVSPLQANQFGFQAEALCNYSGYVSASRASTVATVVAPFTSNPAAPTWINGTSWKSGSFHVINYTTYCPDNTWVSSTSFTSQSWVSGDYYYHSFGFNDWWTLGPGGGATVYYWGRYACDSNWTSPTGNSSDRYTTVWIYP